MKDKILKAIDENRDEIISCGRYILNNPEYGYREFKTAQRVAEEFERLGIPFESGLAVTGDNTAILAYSDFTRTAENGERAKSIMVRKITVED